MIQTIHLTMSQQDSGYRYLNTRKVWKILEFKFFVFFMSEKSMKNVTCQMFFLLPLFERQKSKFLEYKHYTTLTYF